MTPAPQFTNTMKLRITPENQHDLMGFMRMFQHAMSFVGVSEMDRNNVMALIDGAMGEDSLGEYILVPLPPKAQDEPQSEEKED